MTSQDDSRNRNERTTANFICVHWKGILTILIPIICLPVMIIQNSRAYNCVFVMLVMGLYWATDVIPKYVTAMIPLAAFPILRILDTEAVCHHYFSDVVVQYFGSVMFALAVEFSNLHKRIALRSLTIMGLHIRRMHMSVVAISMFLSMWVSTGAVTTMLCPIVKGILEEFEMEGISKVNVVENEPSYVNYRATELTQAFYLGIAYAATIGGSSTLVASSTAMTIKEIYEHRFGQAGDNVDHISFSSYAFPPAVINTVLMCLWLQIFYLGLFRPKSKGAFLVNLNPDFVLAAKTVISERCKDLGPLNLHEIQVMILISIRILVGVTKESGHFKGWGDENALQDFHINELFPTYLCLILCFLLPANYSFIRYIFRKTPRENRKVKSLLEWRYVKANLAWGIILLLGSAFVLEKASEETGLSSLIRQTFHRLENWPQQVTLLFLIVILVIFTMFNANLTLFNILAPFIIDLAVAIRLHPLYLLLPANLACNISFLLPVSSGPNAIVAETAHIRTRDMVKVGLVPTIMSIIVVYLTGLSWAYVIYPKLGTFPKWAELPNGSNSSHDHVH